MAEKKVDAKILKKWLDEGEAVLVDVREPAERAAKNITGSIALPLSDISKQKIPAAKNKKLVLHCQSGRRASQACKKLLAEDSGLEIYNLDGGISAWSNAGYEIEGSGQFFLPLDRQVQLTIGLCVFCGSLAAYFINPLFNILTGFFGAGLIFAGVSGFCGLAMVMAKMPWNK